MPKKKYDIETIETVKGLRLIDDVLFRHVAAYYGMELAEGILEALEVKAEVAAAEAQKELNTIQGGRVVFDFFITTNPLCYIVFEVQKEKEEFPYERMEVYLAFTSIHAFLRSKNGYKGKGPVRLVLLSEQSLLGEGKGKYEATLVGKSSDFNMKDALRITEINAGHADPNTPWGKLANDFLQTDPSNIFNIHLKKIMHEVKCTKKGVNEMCEAVERLAKKREARGMALGIKKGEELGLKKGADGERHRLLSHAAGVFARGEAPLPEIAKCTGLSEEEILRFAERTKQAL